MNIAMILIGGLIFLSFPFVVLQKIKKMKHENGPMSRFSTS